MIPIVYYAHNLSIYHTEQEQQELQIITECFPKHVVYNPNRPDIQRAENPMKRCLEVVHDVSITDIVFSMLPDKWIGSGVYAEIRAAQKDEKPVYYVANQRVFLFCGSCEFHKNEPKTHCYKVLS